MTLDAYAIATSWPWSADGREFFVAFLIISGVLVGLGLLIAMLVGDQLDGPVQTTASAVSHSTPMGIGVRPDSLVVGRLPQGDQVFVAAHLGGLTRLEAALAAAAMAAGWLKKSGPQQITVIPDVTPDEPILATLKTILEDPAAGALPRHRLRTAAVRLRPTLEARAAAMGLVRPAERRSLLVLLGMVGVVVAGGVGMLRTLAEGAHGGDYFFLYYVISAEAGLAALFAIALTGRHRQARAWLSWVDDAIDAARADVRAGRTTSAADITLVAAVDGMSLGKTGDLLGLEVFSRQA